MRIEQLFYWASDREWWLGASQGAVGALIGFLGLYVAYKLNQSWEKRKTAHQRTMSGISTVVRLALDLRDYTEGKSNKTQADILSNELLMFWLHELSENPHLANWAKEHSFQFAEYADNGYEYIDRLRMRMAAQIVGSLTWWVGEGFPKQEADSAKVIAAWRATAIRTTAHYEREKQEALAQSAEE